MLPRYPLCLYNEHGNWKTVYSIEEEESLFPEYRVYGYDWKQKNVEPCIAKDTCAIKKDTPELVQQDLFNFDLDKFKNDTQSDSIKNTDLLEDPIDRRHKRGRKPLKRD